MFFPALAYFCNYKYYEYFIIINVDGGFGWFKMLYMYVYLIHTVLIDNVCLYVINYIFSEQRFLKYSNLLKYKLYYNTVFIFLTNILLPNIALREAYEHMHDSFIGEED